MSKIGKLPIQLESGITVEINGRRVAVTGPKGTLETKLPRGIQLEVAENVATVKKAEDDENLDKFYGLSRSLVANMVQGVSKGFEKKLEIQGVGYRGKIEGRDLVLNMGFANPVRVTPPEGITFAMAEGGIISVSGIDKALIGDIAAKIRAIRPPDAYKGKGIRYQGEIIKKKAGKAAKAVGGK